MKDPKKCLDMEVINRHHPLRSFVRWHDRSIILKIIENLGRALYAVLRRSVVRPCQGMDPLRSRQCLRKSDVVLGYCSFNVKTWLAASKQVVPVLTL